MVRRIKTKNYKNLILVGLGLLVLIGLGVWFFKYRHPVKKPTVAPAISSPANQPNASTTAPAPTKSNPGGVVDKNGQTSGSLPSSSQWTTSSSGNITLQQPTAGSVVQNGGTISGLANVSTVQFILTDNSVGLIDQGTLTVVNGKFAGTLEFAPKSSSGKLEVYHPNPDTGAEEDLVNINVNFNQ